MFRIHCPSGTNHIDQRINSNSKGQSKGLWILGLFFAFNLFWWEERDCATSSWFIIILDSVPPNSPQQTRRALAGKCFCSCTHHTPLGTTHSHSVGMIHGMSGWLEEAEKGWNILRTDGVSGNCQRVTNLYWPYWDFSRSSHLVIFGWIFMGLKKGISQTPGGFLSNVK